MYLKQVFVIVHKCVPFVSICLVFLGVEEWDEIFLNSNYLAGIRRVGING